MTQTSAPAPQIEPCHTGGASWTGILTLPEGTDVRELWDVQDGVIVVKAPDAPR
jgi:hypothetical protein